MITIILIAYLVVSIVMFCNLMLTKDNTCHNTSPLCRLFHHPTQTDFIEATFYVMVSCFWPVVLFWIVFLKLRKRK